MEIIALKGQEWKPTLNADLQYLKWDRIKNWLDSVKNITSWAQEHFAKPGLHQYQDMPQTCCDLHICCGTINVRTRSTH